LAELTRQAVRRPRAACGGGASPTSCAWTPPRSCLQPSRRSRA